MNVRRLVAVAVFALAASPQRASADSLPPNYKSVGQYIVVKGAVPAGKAVVLANTFLGLDVVKMGESASVEWHPSGGDMKLAVIEDKELANIAKMRTDGQTSDRDGLKKIADGGLPCGVTIAGIRTIPETEPWVDIRRTYEIAVQNGACVAKLTMVEYLDKSGKPVKPITEVVPSPGSAAATATTGTGAPATTTTGAGAPAAQGGCSCSVIGSHDSTSPSRAPLATALFAASVILASRRRKGAK